jgi:hypothetical protein
MPAPWYCSVRANIELFDLRENQKKRALSPDCDRPYIFCVLRSANLLKFPNQEQLEDCKFVFQLRQSYPMILKTTLSGICLLVGLVLSAQNKETDLNLPYSNKIELNDQALESLFHSEQNISLELGTGFHLEGKVQNKTDHGNSLISLLIEVSSAPGGMFSISRYVDPSGKIVYAGRMLKLHDPDGLLLVREDQHYYFIATEQRFLVAE